MRRLGNLKSVTAPMWPMMALTIVFCIALLAGCGADQTRKIGNVDYPVNESGQTYGGSEDAFKSLPEGTTQYDVIDFLPDLVRVSNSEGTVGYVPKEDFFPPTPKTPKEAKAMAEEAGAERVPMYEADGETIIGVWDTPGIIVE